VTSFIAVTAYIRIIDKRYFIDKTSNTRLRAAPPSKTSQIEGASFLKSVQ